MPTNYLSSVASIILASECLAGLLMPLLQAAAWLWEASNGSRA